MDAETIVVISLWPIVMISYVILYTKFLKFLKSYNDISVFSRCRYILKTAIISNFFEATSVTCLGFLIFVNLYQEYKYSIFFFVISIFAHHCHFISNILRVYRLNLLSKLHLGQYWT